jgi:hypothetical protein
MLITHPVALRWTGRGQPTEMMVPVLLTRAAHHDF